MKPQTVRLTSSFLETHRRRSWWWQVRCKLGAIYDSLTWQILFILSLYLQNMDVFFTVAFERISVTHLRVYILESVFLANYILTIIVYFSKDVHIYMTDPPKSKTILIIDSFLVIPYAVLYNEIVAMPSNSYEWNPIASLTLNQNSAIRLYHVLWFFSIRNNSRAGVNHWGYFFGYYLLILFFLLHYVTCTWYLLAHPLFTTAHESWLNHTTFDVSQLDNIYKWYLFCFYYALTSSANSHYGDISATTLYEQAVSIIAMSVGFLVTTVYLIGSMQSRFLNGPLRRRGVIRREVQRNIKYLQSNMMAEQITRTINLYFKVLWKHKNGVADVRKLLSLLPTPLRSEICYDINIRPLNCSTIFRDKPEAFLRAVSNMMKHEFYLPGEMIFSRNVTKAMMIFVVMGHIEILSDEDDESPIISFGPGTCLGESSLCYTQPSKACVRTSSYTELQVLYRKRFSTLSSSFPEIYQEINGDIHRRIAEAAKSTVDAKKVMVNLYKFRDEELTIIRKVKEKLRRRLAKTEADKYLSMYQLYETNIKPMYSYGIDEVNLRSFIVNPNSPLAWCWERIIVLMSLGIAISYPYFIVVERNFPPTFQYISQLMEMILVLDVLVLLLTAVETKNETVYTLSGIFRERVQDPGFYIDVFSACYLEELTINKSLRAFYLLKANRILKCYRVFTFFQKVENNLETTLLFIRLLKYILIIIICGYWFGNLFYLISCYDYVCEKHSWFFLKLMDDVKKHVKRALSEQPYLVSLYFAICTFSSATGGDITPGNLPDIGLVCFCVLMGTFLRAYCTAELASSITNTISSKIKYQETFLSIEKFIQDKTADKLILKRVRHFFVLQWYYDQGNSIGKHTLFSSVTTQMQKDILINERVQFLSSLPFFVAAKLHVVSDCLELLSRVAETIVLPPGEIICRKNEPSKSIIFIQDGYCVRKRGRYRYLVGPHSCIGAMISILHAKTMLTVVTQTHVKILRIPDQTFWKVLSMFPSISRNFQEAVKTFNLTKEMETLDREYYTYGRIFQDWTPKRLKGSIINVYEYCLLSKESYGDHFKETFGVVHYIKFIIPPICILPHGLFLQIWILNRVICAIILGICMPYVVIAPGYFTALEILVSVIDVITYVDLVFMMFVGYFGPNTQLIIHPIKSMKHYLCGKFIMDLLFCFPFYTTFCDNSPIVGLLKVGQAYRIFQYFQYLEEDIKKKFYFMQILKTFIISTITAHLFAAMLTLSNCHFVADDVANNVTGGVLKCDADSMFETSRYAGLCKPFDTFILALYFCVSVLTSCYLGDISPTFTSNLLICITMIVVGILYYGYMYAKISSYLANWDTIKSSNQEMLRELNYFLKRENVTKKTKHRILNHYEYVWRRSGGAESNEILRNLHVSLHEDVILNIYEDVLRKVPLFRDAKQSFFRTLGKQLNESYFYKQDTIFRVSDVASDIYIIYRGSVVLSHPDGGQDIYMKSGAIFGNLQQTGQSQMERTIIALNYTDCLYMKSFDFFDILKAHPDIETRLRAQKTSKMGYIMHEGEDERRPTSSLSKLDFDNEKNSSKRSLPLKMWHSISVQFLILMPWKWFRVAINPNQNIFNQISGSGSITVFVALLNFVSTTYAFVFQSHSIYTLVVCILCDVYFFEKLFYDLHKGYEDEFGEIILDNKKILKNFFAEKKTLRIIQILTSTPHHYLVLLLKYAGIENSFLYFTFVRMHTLLRSVYIYLDYLEGTSKLFVPNVFLQLQIIIYACLVLVHTTACIWYLVACPVTYCIPGTWAYRRYEDQHSQWQVYFLSLYYNLQIITTTASGDFKIDIHLSQMIYTIVVMLFINCIIGVFIGNIVNAVDAFSASLSRFEYEICSLKTFLVNVHVSPFQVKKMWQYVTLLWGFTKGRQMPRLLAKLPQTLHQDLMYEIYGHHLRDSYIFGGLDSSFIKQLSSHFKHIVIFPYNYVVQYGDSDKCMYFIHSGEIDILTIHPNLTETIHDTLQKGEMFGVIQGLYYGIPHNFAFRAKTNVHIISLCLSAWEDLLLFFPECKKEIYERVSYYYQI